MRNYGEQKRTMNNKRPLVSISCITFNHASYIRQCLDGFLMQKTNFEFEVLIHDDASSDGTEQIIREYEAEYPDIIKPLYEKENQWVKGRRGSKIFNYPRAKGKYIALCEGDDYWTDPLKLQKQVDFLEVNLDYGLVHTKAKIYNQTKNRFLKYTLGDENNTYLDLLFKNRITTATVLFRKDLLLGYLEEIKPLTHNWKMGDYPMWLWFAYHTKIKLLSDCTTVRRLVSESLTNKKNKQSQITFFRSSIAIKEFFIQKYDYLEQELEEFKKYISESKIRKGVLLTSYELYKEGICDKRLLSYKISVKERVYGLLLKNKVSRYCLSFLFSFRKTVV